MKNKEAIEILKDLWRYEHSEFSEKEIREALEKGIEALEKQKSVIEELERYKKMYSKLKNSKNKLKKTIQDNLLKNDIFIRAYYLDSTSGFIIETQKIIDSHFDKYIKENKK